LPEAKIGLAVVFGGRSGEHEVSCKSAASILAHLDRGRYDVLPVKICRDGRWVVGEDAPEVFQRGGDEALALLDGGFRPGQETGVMSSMASAVARLSTVDVVFPALHGPQGEDGTLQAVFEMAGTVFVGNGVLASALGMDKEFTKKVLVSAGLAVADGVVLREATDDVSPAERERLGLPVFVKPSRAGSSLGVSKVDDWDELPAALALARKSDTKVLVEASVPGREIDVGVLERPGGGIEASPPLEILTTSDHGFFDYTAKYTDSQTVLDVPANVDPAVVERLHEEAARAFRALDCSGLLRVDFFVTPDGDTVVNEVNTFPGFTRASQYPAMWSAAGLEYGALLDVLIDTALWRAGLLAVTPDPV
jgi:D-alanine-D-alanine ligase